MQSPERGAKLTVMGLVRALAFDENRAHKGHLAQARLPLNPSPQQRLFSVYEGWADGFLTRRSWVRLPPVPSQALASCSDRYIWWGGLMGHHR